MKIHVPKPFHPRGPHGWTPAGDPGPGWSWAMLSEELVSDQSSDPDVAAPNWAEAQLLGSSLGDPGSETPLATVRVYAPPPTAYLTTVPQLTLRLPAYRRVRVAYSPQRRRWELVSPWDVLVRFELLEKLQGQSPAEARVVATDLGDTGETIDVYDPGLLFPWTRARDESAPVSPTNIRHGSYGLAALVPCCSSTDYVHGPRWEAVACQQLAPLICFLADDPFVNGDAFFDATLDAEGTCPFPGIGGRDTDGLLPCADGATMSIQNPRLLCCSKVDGVNDRLRGFARQSAGYGQATKNTYQVISMGAYPLTGILDRLDDLEARMDAAEATLADHEARLDAHGI
jgi:hypothetical protein